LAQEMLDLGISGVTMDGFGFVYGYLPATPGCEHAAPLGFIAHLDTADDVPNAEVTPRVVEGYDGGVIDLGAATLSPADAPALANCVGCDLVVTDGRTLLGADDKAGIAEIMTLAERLLADPALPHGTVCLAFTPDEEIGGSTDKFDLARFGAKAAYTLDGEAFGTVVYQNFNAATAHIEIFGNAVHTGTAKNLLINAASIAAELDALLPKAERPEHTQDFEGFYHLESLCGSVRHAECDYLLRDHDAKKLASRKAVMADVCDFLCRRYGAGTVQLTVTDSYRNMEEKIKPHYAMVERAFAAIREAGGTPKTEPARGGTDGANLSWRGLPCPDMGTGSYLHHSVREFACVQEMDKVVESLVALTRLDAT
ncbi:MAG: peptidase T, partial [Oscillospiraceae bacterium]|nr:peptidase T [Oscillospiraceae bacterium]